MSSEEKQSTDNGNNGSNVKDGNVNAPPTVPLFQASRDAFNDRAWNDPPPGLINLPNPGGVIKSSRPKLTERVAFSLQPSKLPPAQGSQNVSFNPTGPPPMSGFVPQAPPK